ncbi:T9SS type A sorting domain-containing protein [Flavivirga jejuensis]|uniref:T9SS type A sorting domain-containing protein n=1 Tax=Flavivirga jejuensis TaxID=870487 RepID=A0ABT8WL92_9FLAO|nr:T9SS type A sorting domain-containing protein [Flavivirga jejuensis]MDO5973924.1 T9SS type A sorting domain-containing protein [Flavivirga jejuensis]
MMKKQHIYILLILIFITSTINAQCYPDRHSTSWIDSWISCDISQNPNSAYGLTHWIMYDLGYEYELKESKFWNANEPKNLNYGINDYNLDYSLDAVTWTNLGTFKMDQASGLSTYEGGEGPDFDATKARYVLITPISNYGGDCYGLSEIKINITDPFDIVEENNGFNALVYPNPFLNNINLRIVTLDETSSINYTLYDMLGRAITSNSVAFTENTEIYELPINANTLSAGIYILNVEQNNKTRSFKIIKRE